ncbi:DNA alkylation repair protein [Winogradskyella aurantiaca]|uniref:DNA alkylation repair protein n=1 Tax=Winogradskyella aurantiaca TaxID=2219558 RepID=UPI000E1D5787|nr:DNA alkylation repair protein [Winogradskyella aurantiaca]
MSTKKDLINLLKQHRNERGVDHWRRLNPDPNGLQSFGVGLTVLRKLAKKIGKNHKLAAELWPSNIYDVKIISLLIDDPKFMTVEQAESKVDQLYYGYLAHVFSSCDAALAKTSFVVPLLMEWINSNSTIRKRCGYGLLYEVSKSTKKSAPDTDFYLDRIAQIGNSYANNKNSVRLAMATALMGMGKKNITLNSAALEVAKKMGPIEVTSGVSKCEPFDVSKHLTSDYIRNKLS